MEQKHFFYSVEISYRSNIHYAEKVRPKYRFIIFFYLFLYTTIIAFIIRNMKINSDTLVKSTEQVKICLISITLKRYLFKLPNKFAPPGPIKFSDFM